MARSDARWLAQQEERRQTWQYRLDSFLRDLLGGLVYGLVKFLGTILLYLGIVVGGLIMWAGIFWLWCFSFMVVGMAPLVLGSWIFYLLGWSHQP
jgi:hypothetical protein